MKQNEKQKLEFKIWRKRMKKIRGVILSLVLMMLFMGCSSTKKFLGMDSEAKINDITVVMVTTQGEIEFYLYPEAAPITVANFINLAKRGYYDNTKIHRAIEHFMAQGGDPTGTGQGGPGYTIPDETVNWLDFFQPGMLAMANAGPGTGGSQFFITTQPAEWLNGKHTVFGETIKEEDLKNSANLEVGDVIKEIKIIGNADFILSMHKDQVDEWNVILDEKYPHLKKYPVKPVSAYGNMKAAYEEELESIYARKKEDDKEITLSPVPRFIKKVGDKFRKDTSSKDAEEIYFPEEQADLVTPEGVEDVFMPVTDGVDIISLDEEDK